MNKIIYIFALVVFTFFSCDKNESSADLPDSTQSSKTEYVNRPIRPVVLGEKLNNPFSVENMQAALDSLKAHTDQLDGCMRAPSAINEIEITTTDLYVRFLPQDSVQYATLMSDSTLTLFDFPLDYKLKQDGEYYKDPTVMGDFTWLYTRVPKGYQPPAGITYEVISELFLYENSPYYTEETIGSDSIMKAKSKYGTDMNDALKTIKAIAFFNTGNKYGEDVATTNGATTGRMKIAKRVKKHFWGRTWYETEYFPSGTIKVEGYHQMNANGEVNNYSTLTHVPLKGVKIHLWNWFKWNSVYTNENGYYESDIYYNGDPVHYIYFSGKNKNNHWDLDRVAMWGVCLWVQKLSLGEQSKNEYSTTVTTSSGGWDACITNNAFYEYMTVCDKEGLTRPPYNLQVALREMSGSSSAPLFQNHENLYSTATLLLILGRYAGSLVASRLPDVLISGGTLNEYKNSSDYYRKFSFNGYYSTIWHELTHASNFQRVKNEQGFWPASAYWRSIVITEIGHSDNYGQKGDNNWQQIALCEGWANYIEWKMPYVYLAYNDVEYNYPASYWQMFNSLYKNGCSLESLEKCLTAKTIVDYENLLTALYPELKDKITSTIKYYE